MDLCETFSEVSQSIVAFICTMQIGLPGQPPLFPRIIGTGFVIDQDGIVATNKHVVDYFGQLPKDPRTGRTAVATLLFVPDKNAGGLRVVASATINAAAVSDFTTKDEWRGNPAPDIGMVQIEVKGVPPLSLATEDFYVRPGMDIATAGFPMGELPLTVFGTLNQLMPFVRRGIVSSVFPFTSSQPHGFTIDILQQGGSSGSPIFRTDRPEVVGMMASSVLDWDRVATDTLALAVSRNSNISVCEPGPLIKDALQLFRRTGMKSIDGLPTLAERIREPISDSAPIWETFPAGSGA